MFIYHRNVSVSIVPIIRKRNNDALTNNIYSFFLKYIQMKYIQTDTHLLLFIRFCFFVLCAVFAIVVVCVSLLLYTDLFDIMIWDPQFNRMHVS
jgi:hypothetical protein